MMIPVLIPYIIHEVEYKVSLSPHSRAVQLHSQEKLKQEPGGLFGLQEVLMQLNSRDI